MIKRIRVWNIWRKRSLNGKFYKLLVLFGFANSPTFIVELELFDTFKGVNDDELA